jgi:hypothetical protein
VKKKAQTLIDEVDRVYGKSDMMSTAHSILSACYSRSSLIYDSINIFLTTWVCSLVFVDPVIAKKLSPITDERLWLGFLAVLTFIMSIMDLRLNWKSKRDLHMKAVEFFSKMKIRARAILADKANQQKIELEKFLEEYRISAPQQVLIPDSKFNQLKKQHLLKVEISKHLSKYPGASIILFKIHIWWRDNIHAGEEDPSESSSGGL